MLDECRGPACDFGVLAPPAGGAVSWPHSVQQSDPAARPPRTMKAFEALRVSRRRRWQVSSSAVPYWLRFSLIAVPRVKGVEAVSPRRARCPMPVRQGSRSRPASRSLSQVGSQRHDRLSPAARLPPRGPRRAVERVDNVKVTLSSSAPTAWHARDGKGVRRPAARRRCEHAALSGSVQHPGRQIQPLSSGMPASVLKSY